MHFTAICAPGLEGALRLELEQLGCIVLPGAPARGAVRFEGPIRDAYRACITLRSASRVLLSLAHFEAKNVEEIYDGARTIRWAEQILPGATLAVHVAGGTDILGPRALTLKTKDAIVDVLRDARGTRPDISTDNPDFLVHVFAAEHYVEVSVDLSGGSMHERGYRRGPAQAPLKETLAAGLLLLAGWPKAAALFDPMCGSGTFAIEAALIAANKAPGVMRGWQGPRGWTQNDETLVAQLKAEARSVEHVPKVPIYARDSSHEAVHATEENARRAGVLRYIERSQGDFSDVPPSNLAQALVVVNPPYGERLETDRKLYSDLGDTARQQWCGARVFVLAPAGELGKEIGLRATKKHVVWNGPIECRWLEFPISATAPSTQGPRWRQLPPEAEAFANRLQKNARHWGKWAKRTGTTCYRIYDADLPEYAVAVDLYEGRALVQEYEAPRTVDPDRAQERWRHVTELVPRVLDLSSERVFFKYRRRQRDGFQYGRMDSSDEFFEAHENGLRFWVNLRDYLDSGLYLDQRNVRAELAKISKDKHFLNLFAYTATATVYAAKAGAKTTTSVDLSNTYLDWAEKNFELNDIPVGRKHALLRADVLEWLHSADARFDVVFCSPPSYSASKKMSRAFEIQHDHEELLAAIAPLMSPGGVIVFSTHARRFKMRFTDSQFDVTDMTTKWIPPDFERRRPHYTFVLSRR